MPRKPKIKPPNIGSWANRMSPGTPEERESLSGFLIEHATHAALHGGTPGLANFLLHMRDPVLKKQIASWLNHYTTIKLEWGTRGIAQLTATRVDGFDLSAARLNPYWSCSSVEISPSPPPTPETDRKYIQKRLRNSIDQFIDSPCRESIEKVNSIMEEYAGLTPSGRRNGLVVSGGLPGLGKRR